MSNFESNGNVFMEDSCESSDSSEKMLIEELSQHEQYKLDMKIKFEREKAAQEDQSKKRIMVDLEAASEAAEKRREHLMSTARQ